MFRRFENNDFDVEDKERSGAPEKFEDEELEALLDEDSCQTLGELAESLGADHTTLSERMKALRMIQKQESQGFKGRKGKVFLSSYRNWR